MNIRFGRISILILCVVSLFLSCDDKAEQPKEETTTIMPPDKEARESFNAIGEVESVVLIDSSNFFTKSRATGMTLIDLSEDEEGITSVFHLVSFSSLEKNFEQFTSECPKSYLDLQGTLPWKYEYEGKVLIRSHYFEVSSKPAHREAYFIDGYDEDSAMFIVREINVSPDYSYSIDAEIEIKTGLPKKYDWRSQSVKESNHYVEDNETDFGPISGSISKAWKYVDVNGNLVEANHSAARYIVEVDKASASDYMKQKLFTSNSDRLRIGNFIYEGADKENKAYLELNKYPEGYKHEWAIRCYWYEDGSWNYTGNIQTDSDFVPIWYKMISISDYPVLEERLSPLGNITVLYQVYKGDFPYYFSDDNRLEFAIEFDTIHQNLNKVSKNPRGKIINKVKSTWFGLLRQSTVGYAYLYLYKDESTSILVLTEEPNSSRWYTSYTYLPLDKVGDSIRINGQDLDHPGFFDEEAGKYFSYSNWNGEKYWSEYDGDVDFEKTLSQLGDLESIQYFVGETGQTAPFITTFFKSDGSYISMLGTYSSFDEEALSSFSISIFHTKYFTRNLTPYDIDLESNNVYVELDIFFKKDGSISSVQVRKMTDKENAKANGREYAVTYTLPHSFLIKDSE
ncbi:MAG: hypothetical protein ACI4NB_08965 [Candidatus Ornithospirochaeta sp.]